MERDKGIGPSALPWEGSVLPLYKSRADRDNYTIRGAGFTYLGILRTWPGSIISGLVILLASAIFV